MKQLPTVFVINENPAVLSSIAAILTALSYEVKCFASDEEFIAQHDSNLIGCIVIDLAMAAMRGSKLIRHLHATPSSVSVVIISGLIEAAVNHQHEHGPVPILAKAHEVWALSTMVDDAIAGSLKRSLTSMHILSSQVELLHQYATSVPAHEKIVTLSPRQRQVLSCLLAGNRLKEVAQKLELSEHTVGDYVKQIYKHFGVSSRATLLAMFISPGQL